MKDLLTLSLIYLCFGMLQSNAQQLQKPELAFDFACASPNHNQFKTSVTFKDAVFRGNNVFQLELSDDKGNFDSPKILASVSDKNYAFSFDILFSLPEEVSGSGYKLRVRASMPEQISPESKAFDAYFISNQQLILNDFKDVSICDATTTTISLNTDIAKSYRWYKDGKFYKETTKDLVVTQSGDYYAEPNFGACTGSVYSNMIIVTLGDSFVSNIQGASQLEVCPGETKTLYANIDDSQITYQWYLDNTPITNANTSQHTFVASEDTFGSYSLKMQRSGCEAISDEVAVYAPDKGLQVQAITATDQLIWKDKSATLQVQSSASNVEVSWFKNDIEISSGSQFILDVNVVGTYYAMVAIVGSCAPAVKSPTFHVRKPEGFLVTLGTSSDFINCESTQTKVSIMRLQAFTNQGQKQDLDTVILDDLSAQWFLGSELIHTALTELELQSHLQSGVYSVQGRYCNIPLVSNRLEVNIGFDKTQLTVSKEIACESQKIQLKTTAVEEVIYAWYKNQVLIAETLEPQLEVEGYGDYGLELRYMGCSQYVEKRVQDLGSDVLTLSDGPIIYMQTQQGILVEAFGADSYIWTDSTGQIVSKNARVELSQTGVYTLKAFFGVCEITKEIEVKENNAKYISNVITPNNDNINDKWILPAKFVNDPEVEITILNGNGKAVFKTVSYQNNWPQAQQKSQGVYYYLIRKKGAALAKGSITVIGS
ncbi:MAG: gliding motility-associated C-terminal domain-containing protein [Flavobacteriaceae bacterium]|nr:gliding motility-associated C-terminal domain-containing protein [Flavobacteriaceae bacterium]